MTRFIMSRLPYSWVERIDFFMHGTAIPWRFWRPVSDELGRRNRMGEATPEGDRKKWWEQ